MDAFWASVWSGVLAGLILTSLCGCCGYLCLRNLNRWRLARALAPAKGTHFTVLVADLVGDCGEKRQHKHVLNSLMSQFRAHETLHAIEVRAYPKSLAIGVAGNLADIDRAAEKKGRAWLAEQNADLLIWGEVAAADRVIRLRFMPREGPTDAPRSYSLSDKLELPLDFKDDLGQAIATLAVAGEVMTRDPSRPPVPALKPMLSRFDNLVTHGSDLPPRIRASLAHAAGTIFHVYGTQACDASWLAKSAAAFRAAISAQSRSNGQPDWASQNNLGTALRGLAELSEGEVATNALEEATEAFRAALKVNGRDEKPLEWAKTQSNLANALMTLGQRIDGDEGVTALNEAITIGREAVAVLDSPETPDAWVSAQNNLGNALHSLAARVGGDVQKDALREAAVAYRAVLTTKSASKTPVDWALLQNNLGNTLTTLGDHSEGEASMRALHEAIAAYREVLTVATREDTPMQWAATHTNLASALRALGERSTGEAAECLLEESVAASRAVLSFVTRRGMPAKWAMIHNNLANTLRILGDRKADDAGIRFLQESIAACREALSIYSTPGMEFLAAKTRGNLAMVESVLAKKISCDRAA